MRKFLRSFEVFASVLLCLFLRGEISLAYSPPLQQQGIYLDGIVIDESAAPVVGAQVSVTSPSISLKKETDATGHFHFEGLPKSTLALKITAKHFATIERKVNPVTEPLTQMRITLRPAPLFEQVTVTATRTEGRIGETAASVAIINSEDLKSTAAITVDDALRQVPGFSLFRRSGSRTANPTSQGVSLRGLGASGASRALVLLDGVPLNDPFGGWVYWSRIPRESITQVEVLRGGASHLYGGSAIGGVVNILTRQPEFHSLSLEASYGNQQTPDVSLYIAEAKGKWSGRLQAEVFHTDGYILVSEAERGNVDTPAGARHTVMDFSLERHINENSKLFGDASFFGEARENGTPLQTNRTHIRNFIVGGNWQSRKAGLFTFRSYGGTEIFDQNFSAIGTNRNTETLTRVQRTPVQLMAISTQWSLALGAAQTLVAGIEARAVRGASDEIAYTSGQATSLIGAGGRQRSGAIYLEDLIRIGSRLFINAGARLDDWRNYAGLSATRPIAAGTGTLRLFPDRDENALSPQLSALYKLTDHVALTTSVTKAFRAPTLNELYRSFRVGNVLTLANEELRAERLTGGEAGVRLVGLKERVSMRGTGFWNVINGPIANVTLLTTPALITRQRQNLGRTRSRGVEIEADLNLSRTWNLSTGYLFADATVVRFPANTALEGLRIPQVARQQFTFQARYSRPSIITLSLQGRASSSQFDDDQNLFRLNRYFTLDAFVSRRLTNAIDVFAAVENLFNQRYEIGKTPVTTLGSPTLIRGGFRFHLGAK